MIKIWSDIAWNGYWSRRIDKENRLVYKVEEEKLYIVQCGTHYKQ
ncbi:MAG: type II toxin-antitoxin system YoeB family toxin [Treponema sp.]|nr:type II toxin-antitoxin system YoeB family toxin [Treponema sp.]